LQIYDALLPLLVLGAVVALDRRGGAAARPFLLPVMAALYALTRFATEFLRPRASGEALLLSQWLELGAVLAVVALLAVGRRAWLRLVRPEPALGKRGDRPSAPQGAESATAPAASDGPLG
jgi:prolipoprotein diacylglyceryltransferase